MLGVSQQPEALRPDHYSFGKLGPISEVNYGQDHQIKVVWGRDRDVEILVGDTSGERKYWRTTGDFEFIRR